MRMTKKRRKLKIKNYSFRDLIIYLITGQSDRGSYSICTIKVIKMQSLPTIVMDYKPSCTAPDYKIQRELKKRNMLCKASFHITTYKAGQNTLMTMTYEHNKYLFVAIGHNMYIWVLNIPKEFLQLINELMLKFNLFLNKTLMIQQRKQFNPRVTF